MLHAFFHTYITSLICFNKFCYHQEHLRLNSNQMVGTIPTELGRLSNLQVLDLDSNNLTGTLPTELGKLINVTGLHLSSNSLKGTIPSEIGG